MSQRDPYLVLGVAPVAKPEEIRSAYRDLSKKYHPDTHQDVGAAAADKMKEITAAHQVVSNKQKREDYDNQPQFRVRAPRGFAKQAAGSAAMFTKKHEERKPGFMDKLMGFMFVKKEETKRDPQRAMTHFTMGMTMTEKKDFYDQAMAEFTAAMKHDPMMVEAAYNFALMAYKLGRFEDARTGFQKVLKIKGDDAQARLMLDLLRPEEM